MGGRSGLRRDLMLWLTLPIVVIVLTTAALGTYAAHRLVERVFDRWLLDAARSMAALLTFDKDGKALLSISSQADAVLMFDDNDKLWYSATQGARLLTGQVLLPDHGPHEASYSDGTAYDALLQGRQVRLARTEVGPNDQRVTVLVAETRVKRAHAEQELVAFLWPMALLVPSTAVIIFFVVRRTVSPLEEIAARWSARSNGSLEAISLDEVPREMLPFAQALNELLGRIRAMLVRERQFAATSAHQLRTPLASLALGLVRARQSPDLISTRRVLDELSSATQRTARVVQQLLAFGRLDPETRHDVAFESKDLVELCYELGGAHMDFALAKNIDFEFTAPEQKILVSVQSDLFLEALGNLIDNALRYTPHGGRVVLEVEDDPPIVRVADSGPGIPVEERDKVFKRFFRGRTATGEGSGLGLAIVREICKLHFIDVVLGNSSLGGTAAELRFDRSPVVAVESNRANLPRGSSAAEY